MFMKRGFALSLLPMILISLWYAPSFADDSVSPYIDKLKSQMNDSSSPARSVSQPEPYIQYLKKDPKLAKPEEGASESAQPYLDRLRQANPGLNPQDSSGSYTEKKKEELGPDESKSAIEAVRDGTSQLHLKRPGPVRGSIGFKVGALLNRDFGGSAPYVALPYNTIYGSATKWVPDLTFFAEWKPLSSETWGGFGILASGGFSYVKGFGNFSIPLSYNPNPGGVAAITFPATSYTQMTFISMPASIEAKYQFNLLKWLRPYAMIGPTVVGMTENRNDGVSAKKALSKGITMSFGGAILADWISDENAWDLYQDFSIKHIYLTVDYTRINSISSNISISNSGIFAGVTFEF